MIKLRIILDFLDLKPIHLEKLRVTETSRLI